MKKTIAVLSILLSPAFIAAGCSTIQVQHFFSSLETLEEAYCSELNADNRKIILDKIHSKYPNYPKDGLCEYDEKIDKLIEGK